jgi:hypothetical protein
MNWGDDDDYPTGSDEDSLDGSDMGDPDTLPYHPDAANGEGEPGYYGGYPHQQMADEAWTAFVATNLVLEERYIDNANAMAVHEAAMLTWLQEHPDHGSIARDTREGAHRGGTPMLYARLLRYRQVVSYLCGERGLHMPGDQQVHEFFYGPRTGSPPHSPDVGSPRYASPSPPPHDWDPSRQTPPPDPMTSAEFAQAIINNLFPASAWAQV